MVGHGDVGCVEFWCGLVTYGAMGSGKASHDCGGPFFYVMILKTPCNINYFREAHAEEMRSQN